MELAGPSDVDVLDDLLQDVNGDEGDFEDAEAFFDTDVDQDGEGMEDTTADDILSQLDAVTNLDDEDEAQADNPEEFQDSTSAPSSPTSGNDKADQPSSSTSVVQAVLDLAINSDADDLNEDHIHPADLTHNYESRVSGSREKSSSEGSLGALVKIPVDDIDDKVSTISPTTKNNAESLDRPLAPLIVEDKEEVSNAMPPPAPTAVPVIVGSMNPMEDDNDESDESQGEEDDENTSFPLPLQLNISDDEDEDVLEVNSTVVSSLQIEEKQRLSSKPAQSIEQQAPGTKLADKEENTLLMALPDTKTDNTIDISFDEEVRIAHVTTLEPSSPFSDIHKMAGGTKSDQLSTETTFGISYQSMRKKVDEPLTSAKEDSYSLHRGPVFPDEREFENELELTSDLSFSVSAAVSSSCNAGALNSDDDEFSFDIKSATDLGNLSDDALNARRESLEAKKRKDEEKLLEELKRATDEEKRLLETHKVGKSENSATNEAVNDVDSLSLTELHNMYKRGLGDQEVLIDDDTEKKFKTKSEGGQSLELDRSTSVMGRIFSQTHGVTDPIAEEADDEDVEGEGSEDNDVNAENSKAEDENADTSTKIEKNEAGEAEWREIKLVLHRQSHDGEKSESGVSAEVSNSTEAMSVSRISYADAAGYYAATPDVMQHRDIIVSEDFPRGSCLSCLSKPRLTFDGAIEERDRVFCIAATAFDAHNDVVVGVLQTIYKKITKSPRDVLLIGRHWEDIGFQGTDPSTDLRGCGVLSLLQILYLVESYPDLAQRFYTLSVHPTRHFPFACVLINITLQCVVALRNGALYPECNKHASVLSGMNRLFVALTSQLHDSIQSRSDEIPLILKDVLDRGRLHPTKVINEAFDGIALRTPRSAAAPTKTKTAEDKEADNNLEFTEIGLQSVDEE